MRRASRRSRRRRTRRPCAAHSPARIVPSSSCASALTISCRWRGDLGVGQRAVGGAVGEPHAPPRPCPRRAARRRGRRRRPRRRRAAASRPSRITASNLARGDRVGDDDRQVLAHLREARQVAEQCVGGWRRSPSRSISKPATVSLEVPLGGDVRDGSRRASRRGSPPTSTSAARPGCRNGGPCVGAHLPVDAERRRAAPRARPWRRRSRPAAGAGSRQVAGAHRPGQQRAEVVGLVRQRSRALTSRASSGRPRPDSNSAIVVGAARAVALRRRPAASRAASCAAATARRTSGWRASTGAPASTSRSFSASSGPVKLQPTISCRPWRGERVRRRGGAAAGAASGARRRRGGPAASPAGSRAPSSRATSSIRSASRVMSARRKSGTVTSSPSAASTAVKPIVCSSCRRALARDRDAEQPLDPRVAQADRHRLRAGAAEVDRAGPHARAADLDEQPASRRPAPRAPARAEAASRSGSRPRCAAPA